MRPDEPVATRPSWAWTAPQRRLLLVLLSLMCPVLLLRYACNSTYVPDPPPARGPRYDEVADKIDPNTADAASLAALPSIGEKRAQDIIDYREGRRTHEPDGVVFNGAEDLLRIRGFGRASASKTSWASPVPARRSRWLTPSHG